MRLGVALPTCREGITHPVPYVKPGDFPRIARRAEELGYFSLWSNDHLATPSSIAGRTTPPSFYEPLITCATLAHVTDRLRFVVSVLVLPQREIVLAAKQIATLDAVTGGRVVLGVGIGAYREEFEAVHPELKAAHRGVLLAEGVHALRLLFARGRARFAGTYVRFEDVELAPTPTQQPFPIHVSARDVTALRRAGRIGDGLIVSGLSPAQLAEARGEFAAGAHEAGREAAHAPCHAQAWVSFGRTRDEARARLRGCPALGELTGGPAQSDAVDFTELPKAGILFGTADDVIQQLRAFAQAGVGHLGLVFLGETTRDLLADMALFAELVMPAFRSSESAAG